MRCGFLEQKASKAYWKTICNNLNLIYTEMENMNVRQEIKQFIAENFLFTEDTNKLDDDTSFMDEGIIDSMGVMELIVFIEETYKINVENDEIEPDNLDSVNNLYNFIMRKTESKQVAA